MFSLHTTRISLAFAILFLIVLSSCSNNSKKENEVIKALNEGIENSTDQIRILINDPIESLKGKLQEMPSKERAQVWYPKAEKIQQLSSDISGYIENIKRKIKDTSINSAELFDKLKQYQEQVLQVDPKIGNEFQKSLPVFTRTIDSSKNDQEELFKNYFRNISSESVLAILNKFQNNIKINELKLVTFCNDQVGRIIIDDGYSIASIVIANSMVFNPEDTIEITAGMIAFNKSFNTRVFIYQKEFDATEDGFVHHKFRVPSKPGKYYIPVKINYTDPNGRQQTIQKEIEYTVANIQKQ